MGPSSQFLQLVPARVRAALERIKEQIWIDPCPVTLEQTPVTPQPVPWSVARRSARRRRSELFHWGPLFHSTWFRLTWKDAGRRHSQWLRWRDQAEATVYVRGRAYQGLDVAHRHALLPPGVSEVWINSVCCQSAIWHPGATGLDPLGSRCEGAELVTRDDAAWGAYHDLLVLEELCLHHLGKIHPEDAMAVERPGRRSEIARAPALLRRLLRKLDDALDVYDREGLGPFRLALGRIYRALPAAEGELRAILIGHAHIDLVWLWPEHVGETKAVHTFATAARLMTLYPDFRFSYSQPASYLAVQKREPGLTRRIDRLRTEGRWEATGVGWIEADTLLPCGEALLRGFQAGQVAFEKMNGHAARVLWLPDVFGYAACVPQLLRAVGATGFFTNKVTWSRVSSFPHSSFVWRSPDGSEVLAHVSHETRQFYNGQATVKEMIDGAESYRQSDVHSGFLVPTGYGDGGGGPTEEMCERARRMSDLASLPRAQWGTVEDFFETLQPIRDRLPVWTGEIYLEYHRGTYTTHGELKQHYRQAERALQLREAVQCATGGGPAAEEAWKRLFMAQFHDALPGSSVNEVYAEMNPELAALAGGEQSLAKARLSRPSGKRPALFNPLPVRRAVVVNTGRKQRWMLLPPLAGVVVGAREAASVAPVHCDPFCLDNGRVRAEFSGDGEIRSLAVNGEPIRWADAGAQLWVHVDKPHAFDAWDLDQHVLRLGSRLTGRVRLAAEGGSTLRASLTSERRFGTGSRIRTIYSLEAESTVLRIRYEVDWRDPQSLVKVAFPTDYRGQRARFGGPFGSVLRSQVSGRPADEAQWEVPASRWALVADDGEQEGLMVITESRYGFGCREGVLDVSLLRSALITGESRKFQKAMPPSLRVQHGPRFSDLGFQTIELAVGRFRADATREDMPAALADSLFTPPLAYRGPACSGGFLGLEGGESLIPAWAKPLARNRWLLRCHETMGRRGQATLKLAPGWKARRTAVGDTPKGPYVRAIDFRPYELVGLVIER